MVSEVGVGGDLWFVLGSDGVVVVVALGGVNAGRTAMCDQSQF